MGEYSERRFVERRRYPRLRTIGDHAMVILPDEALVGELVDISMGGLAFYYSDSPDRQEQGRQSGILVGNDDLWLQNFPTRTIKDFVVEIPVFSKRPVLRRRCLAFGPLSASQESLLEQYIWLNTPAARSSSAFVASSVSEQPGFTRTSAFNFPPPWQKSDR